MPTNAADQQEAIVRAALGLLATGGPQALRVRDIADAAGCTTMTVYSRFGGKDGIVEAIFVDGFRRFTHALENANAESDTANLDRAERLAGAYRSWALTNPGSYQVMFTEAVPGFAPSADATAIALRAFEVLLVTVESLQSEGRVRDGDAADIAWALWGTSHGLVMLELACMSPIAGEPDHEAMYSNAIAAIMGGFAP